MPHAMKDAVGDNGTTESGFFVLQKSVFQPGRKVDSLSQ